MVAEPDFGLLGKKAVIWFFTIFPIILDDYLTNNQRVLSMKSLGL